jgi:hypothetical protein
MSPRDENNAVAKWNKETNYGRLLGIKKWYSIAATERW